MYTGKTLFAQIMDFLPWKTFHRIVSRYDGDHRVRTLPAPNIFALWLLRRVAGDLSSQSYGYRAELALLSLEVVADTEMMAGLSPQPGSVP